jgi:hypothetical protein
MNAGERRPRVLIGVDGLVGFVTEARRIGYGRTARGQLRVQLFNIGFWLGAACHALGRTNEGRRARRRRILRWCGDNERLADTRGARGRRGSGGCIEPVKGQGRHQEHRDNCCSEQHHRAFRGDVRSLRPARRVGHLVSSSGGSRGNLIIPSSSGGLAPRQRTLERFALRWQTARGSGLSHWSRGTGAAGAVTSPAGSGDVPSGDNPGLRANMVIPAQAAGMPAVAGQSTATGPSEVAAPSAAATATHNLRIRSVS